MSDDIVSTILGRYNLAVSTTRHVRTSENVVIQVTTVSGKHYALRIRRSSGASSELVESEFILLRDFREMSASAVPAPVPARDGGLTCDVEIDGRTHTCAVFDWVSGDHIAKENVSVENMMAMARSVASFHTFTRTYQPPGGFVRPVYDVTWFFGEQSWSRNNDFVGRLSSGDAAHLREIDARVRSQLAAYPAGSATFGLIHYDLHVGNFLFDESRATMIDFDECGFGYYLFDLAHILFDFVGDARFTEFRDVALETYTSAASVRLPARGELKLFLELQGIAYLNWLNRLLRRDRNVDAMDYWIPQLLMRFDSLASRA